MVGGSDFDSSGLLGNGGHQNILLGSEDLHHRGKVMGEAKLHPHPLVGESNHITHDL